MTLGEQYLNQRKWQKYTNNKFILPRKELLEILEDFYNYLCEKGEIDDL